MVDSHFYGEAACIETAGPDLLCREENGIAVSAEHWPNASV